MDSVTQKENMSSYKKRKTNLNVQPIRYNTNFASQWKHSKTVWKKRRAFKCSVFKLNRY